MKNKIILSILLCLSMTAKAENIKSDEFLWEKQESYLKNMKNLFSGLNIINDNLKSCRENYYKDKSEQEKNNYLGATSDYSTNLLVTSSMLDQSINKLEKTMKDDKETVLKNLRQYEDTIGELLKKEEKRNTGMLVNYKKTFNDINQIYCPSLKF